MFGSDEKECWVLCMMYVHCITMMGWALLPLLTFSSDLMDAVLMRCSLSPFSLMAKQSKTKQVNMEVKRHTGVEDSDSEAVT